MALRLRTSDPRYIRQRKYRYGLQSLLLSLCLLQRLVDVYNLIKSTDLEHLSHRKRQATNRERSGGPECFRQLKNNPQACTADEIDITELQDKYMILIRNTLKDGLPEEHCIRAINSTIQKRSLNTVFAIPSNP